MNINRYGTLYVVATPIGNLKDITFRAVEILQQVDFIIAEDKRHSAPLLNAYGIKTPLMAFHDHNEKQMTRDLVAHLQAGKSLALISDAGTPLINDPGFSLVVAARKAAIKVEPIPGACAVIAALSVAGLPTSKFVFEGFLPPKTKARIEHLQAVQGENRTVVFFEAPHRLLSSLEDMVTVFGSQRRVCIAREMTKLYETFLLGFLPELIEQVSKDSNQQKGELVILLEGFRKTFDPFKIEKILKLLLEDLPLKKAVSITALLSHEKKNFIYDMALRLKKN